MSGVIAQDGLFEIFIGASLPKVQERTRKKGFRDSFALTRGDIRSELIENLLNEKRGCPGGRKEIGSPCGHLVAFHAVTLCIVVRSADFFRLEQDVPDGFSYLNRVTQLMGLHPFDCFDDFGSDAESE